MIAIKRILCPIDFLDICRRALEHAIALARWYESEISVLHVCTVSLPPPAYAEPVTPLIMPVVDREALLEDLRRFAEPARAAGIQTTPVLREGNTVAEILEQARTWPADLVVVGTHGLGGFERLMLGSVTEKLLRKAPCPVLTVPPQAKSPFPGEPEIFKRILCPIDFSASSSKALNYALSLAQETNGSLVLIHVLEGFAEPEPIALGHFTVPEYRRHLEHDAREQLRNLVPKDARDWCEPTEIVVVGKAYREILRVAEEKRADLIVMGVQGRGIADLTFFGSTTNHVVRAATCPVLTIRAG